MKALARSYVWWRGIDKDIEALARQCHKCSRFKADPPKSPVHPWDYPQQPWQRIHIDYVGPFMETNFLLIVDAYTKWVEAVPTKLVTTEKTIHILREIFARFGLPLTLVSDNGPQFRAAEFEEFLKSNGIVHKYSAPYHPSTNGHAERYVYTIKQGLRNMIQEKGDLHTKLCKLLMQYRKVPNSTTGISPAELMLNRAIRTRIDLVTRKVHDKIAAEREERPNVREFHVGDLVQARFYNNKCSKWKFGVIYDRKGNLHYTVLIDNKKHLRHIDQLRPTACIAPNKNYEIPTKTQDRNDEPLTDGHNATDPKTNFDISNDTAPNKQISPPIEAELNPRPDKKEDHQEQATTVDNNTKPPSTNLTEPTAARGPSTSLPHTPQLRRSTRTRKPPDRFRF